MVNFYGAFKAEIWTAVFIMTPIVCLVHYLCFGPKKSEPGNSGFVRRFGTAERFFHWITMLVFLVVMTTGVQQVLGGPGKHHIGPFHGNLGFALVILFLIDLFFWVKDALFKEYDLVWLKSMGGYLSRGKAHLPAGRFNAGQKMYFWLILLTLIALLVSALLMEQGGHGPHSPAFRLGFWWSVHGLLGCLATVMLIGHAYLSIMANPQTARVLWDGTVCRRYAEEHHSRWEKTEDKKCRQLPNI
ncbi:MAG: cytochrome b/b6 domain-containing protein [Syntrophomonas sp.]